MQYLKNWSALNKHTLFSKFFRSSMQEWIANYNISRLSNQKV